MWHAHETRGHAEGSRGGAVAGRCSCGACCFQLQPSSLADGRALPGSVGNSWSWLEGSIDPFLCFPGAVCPFLGAQSVHLTPGSLVVLLPPKDKQGFLPRHDEDLREPLVRRQGSQVSMRVAW